MVRIAGVVLAGGLGRRMGGADKALAPLSGRPLVCHALQRLRPQAEAVAISANGDPARFSQTGAAILPDRIAGFPGPMAGILAGLEWALSLGCDAVATVAVDTPFFPPDMVAALRGAIADADVAIACTGGRLHPTCALWRVGLRPALADALAAGDRRVAGFAERQKLVRVPFDADGPDGFFNINTPDDLALAEARLRGAT